MLPRSPKTGRMRFLPAPRSTFTAGTAQSRAWIRKTDWSAGAEAGTVGGAAPGKTGGGAAQDRLLAPCRWGCSTRSKDPTVEGAAQDRLPDHVRAGNAQDATRRHTTGGVKL